MDFRLLDLPSELIDLIVEHVYLDDRPLKSAIVPLSVTCKALRTAVKPHLFADLTIEFDGYYLNTERAPRWLLDGGASFLPQVMPGIMGSINTLRFVPWRRMPYENYNTETWKFPEDMCMDRAMARLRTIIFDPPHAYTRAILRTLLPDNLNITFEYRNHDSPSAVSMLGQAEMANNTWAVTCANGHQGAIDVARLVCSRLKALQWSFPTNQVARADHVDLLDDLESATILEELHISERILDLNENFSRSNSYAPRICALISKLPLLRRCRIEGNQLTSEFLTILPELTLLQDLSIYSVYRRVFHPGCDLKDAETTEPGSTVDMPWLKLPNLRRLDLRYICKHFVLEQLIPRRLTALRIEFYGGEERINLADMDWLSQHCPKLDRLELDLGSLVGFGHQTDLPEASPTSSSSHLLDMFQKLVGFRHLRTLRLFPSYWYRDKLLSNPFANDVGVASALKVFSQLRSECPSIRTLIICISFGEYPFDIVPRMSLSTRPVKYVLRAIGARDGVLLQWGYGASDEIYEVTYEGDTALSRPMTKPVSPKNFFDDLSENWILPHYELDR